MNFLRLKLAFALLALCAWSICDARVSPPAPPTPKPQNSFCNPPGGSASNPFPGNMCIRINIPYGSDPLQKLDVYMPTAGAHNAPVIFMVHGGGWYQGDKMDMSVVWNKVQNWVPAGAIFVSVNYPLVPKVDPMQQARSVGMALGYAQRNASQWGGDPNKFIVMGFSAGGQLTSLLATSSSLLQSIPKSVRPRPWLGTIALDSAVYDVSATMNNPNHDPVFDQAFGTNQNLWNAASPLTQMKGRIAPFLAICSTMESGSCTRAQAFVDKALGYGSDALVVQEALVHGQINDKLGLPSDYTSQVNAFMAGLTSGSLR